MLVILRIIFGAALVYTVREAWDAGSRATETGDMSAAFWLAVSVALGIANAIVWAPYVGGRLADPLTGAYTRGFFVEQKNYLLKLVRRLDERGHRRLTLLCCFLEGIHRPNTPTAFIIGLQNTREGTWLEKVFAREVYRFDNTQNCVWASKILKRRGVNPGVHRQPEVNLTLRALEKKVEPPSAPLPIPPAPQMMPLERNRQIKLFERDEPATARKRT
jgi:hypothetical protein